MFKCDCYGELGTLPLNLAIAKPSVAIASGGRNAIAYSSAFRAIALVLLLIYLGFYVKLTPMALPNPYKCLITND